MSRIFALIAFGVVAFMLYNAYGYRYFLNDIRENADTQMMMGDHNADINIVAYVDYDSQASRRLYPVLLNLLSSSQKVSVYVRPIESNTTISKLATRIALAAKQDGRFMDVNNALLTSNVDLNENYIRGVVRSLGYGYDKINAEASTYDVINTATGLKREATLLNVGALPVFYINHIKMVGSAYTVSDIQNIIADLRAGRR